MNEPQIGFLKTQKKTRINPKMLRFFCQKKKISEVRNEGIETVDFNFLKVTENLLINLKS